MDEAQVAPAPSLQKISASSQQFKQLISCLRNRKLGLPSPQISSSETDLNKQMEINSNKQQDSGIKQKVRLSIPGRDTIKAKEESSAVTKEHVNPEELEVSPHESLKPLNAITPPLFQSNNDHIPVHSSPISFIPQFPSPSEFSFYSSTSLKPVSSVFPKHLRPDLKVAQIVKQKIKSDRQKQKEKDFGFTVKIQEVEENKVIDFCRKERWPKQNSKPGQLFEYFAGLVQACAVSLPSPFLKKYQNCLYYGQPPSPQPYEGFLLFYTSTIYYGQFIDSVKHGNGTELHFLADGSLISWKGSFQKGAKTGKFKVEKRGEKYIGWIKDGKYDGEGRLENQESIYEGYFENGQKQGYGEEVYPKTGVKFAGIFKNGKFVSKRSSKSISQLPKHHKLPYSSLQKHNQAIKIMRTNHSHFQYSQNPTSAASNLPAFNRAKLQVYLQHSARKQKKERNRQKELPKLWREYEYSLEGGTTEARQQTFAKDHSDGKAAVRVDSSSYEEPLPMPFLTVIKKRK